MSIKELEKQISSLTKNVKSLKDKTNKWGQMKLIKFIKTSHGTSLIAR